MLTHISPANSQYSSFEHITKFLTKIIELRFLYQWSAGSIADESTSFPTGYLFIAIKQVCKINIEWTYLLQSLEQGQQFRKMGRVGDMKPRAQLIFILSLLKGKKGRVNLIGIWTQNVTMDGMPLRIFPNILTVLPVHRFYHK